MRISILMNSSYDLMVDIDGKFYEFDFVEQFIPYGNKRYLHIPSHGYFELKKMKNPPASEWLKIMNKIIESGIPCAVCDCIAYTKEYIDFFVAHTEKFIRMFYTEEAGKVNFTNVVFIDGPTEWGKS
ncbi:hypothetical protein [Klebsiella phage 05F01]|nr:hypothetical protein [Klebsiella phage 05F01]